MVCGRRLAVGIRRLAVGMSRLAVDENRLTVFDLSLRPRGQGARFRDSLLVARKGQAIHGQGRWIAGQDFQAVTLGVGLQAAIGAFQRRHHG